MFASGEEATAYYYYDAAESQHAVQSAQSRRSSLVPALVVTCVVECPLTPPATIDATWEDDLPPAPARPCRITGVLNN